MNVYFTGFDRKHSARFFVGIHTLVIAPLNFSIILPCMMNLVFYDRNCRLIDICSFTFSEKLKFNQIYNRFKCSLTQY